ncbi:hypothetical protein ACX9I7_01220 [Streptomyces sp. L500]
MAALLDPASVIPWEDGETEAHWLARAAMAVEGLEVLELRMTVAELKSRLVAAEHVVGQAVDEGLALDPNEILRVVRNSRDAERPGIAR